MALDRPLPARLKKHLAKTSIPSAGVLALCWLVSAGPSVIAAPASETPRLALVIGDSTYSALPALPACTASAHVVSAALKRAGFDVTERLDVTNGQMGAAIGDFTNAAAKAPGTAAVVYICGYALGFNNRAFLLPVSASIERDTDALTQGLIAKSVLDAVRRSGARAGLVLFDAVAKPGSTEPLSLDALMSGGPPDSIGVAAASTGGLPPEGATPLAAALSAVVVPPEIEAGALLAAVGQRIARATTTQFAMLAPARPAWLEGGPQPRPQPQASAPPVAPPASPAPPAAQAAAPAAAPVTFPNEEHMTEADRRRIQAALLRLGYYDRQVDGVFGPETRAAIRRFQHEIDADMTGRITSGEAGRLLAGTR